MDATEVENRLRAEACRLAVPFLARRGHDWAARLAKLKAPVARLKTHAAILDGRGRRARVGGGTDFNELERELGRKGGSSRLVFYVFDLLYLDGLDLRRAPLIERKAVLADLMAPLDPGGPVKFSVQRASGDEWCGAAPARLRERARRHRVEAQGRQLSVRPLSCLSLERSTPYARHEY
jgi:ATP-dependent DNA ligase